MSPLCGKSFLAYFSVDFRIFFFKVRKISRVKFDVLIKNLSDDFLTIFYWKRFSWCYYWVRRRTGKSKQSTVPSKAHQTKSFRLLTTNFLVVNVHTCRHPQKKNQGHSTYRKETASIEAGSRFSVVGVSNKSQDSKFLFPLTLRFLEGWMKRRRGLWSPPDVPGWSLASSGMTGASSSSPSFSMSSSEVSSSSCSSIPGGWYVMSATLSLLAPETLESYEMSSRTLIIWLSLRFSRLSTL